MNVRECMPVNTCMSEGVLLPGYVCENVSVCECVFVYLKNIRET